jgi:hypothetical protein
VQLDVGVVQDLLVDVYQVVELLDTHHVEVLMDEEQLDLMEVDRLLDGQHDYVQHLLVHVHHLVQVQSVDQDSNLEGIILQAVNEQIHELLVVDVVLLDLTELVIVILFAVHFKHNVDVFWCN